MGIPLRDEKENEKTTKREQFQLLQKGRRCICNCRHGLRMLIRARTTCLDTPGTRMYSGLTLQEATAMTKCECCTVHQVNRCSESQINELFGC